MKFSAWTAVVAQPQWEVEGSFSSLSAPPPAFTEVFICPPQVLLCLSLNQIYLIYSSPGPEMSTGVLMGLLARGPLPASGLATKCLRLTGKPSCAAGGNSVPACNYSISLACLS